MSMKLDDLSEQATYSLRCACFPIFHRFQPSKLLHFCRQQKFFRVWLHFGWISNTAHL